MYYDDIASLETLILQTPAWPLFGKLELEKTSFPNRSFTAIKLSTNGVQGLPCEVPNYL